MKKHKKRSGKASHKDRGAKKHKKRRKSRKRYSSSSDDSSIEDSRSSYSYTYSDDDSSISRDKKHCKSNKKKRKHEKKKTEENSCESITKKSKKRRKHEKKETPSDSSLQKSKNKKTNSNDDIDEKNSDIEQNANHETGNNRGRMAPMTREEYEKQQSVIRRVYDEASGRYRLVKGSGEIIEQVVSRDIHERINSIATQGDGMYFARQVARKSNI